MKKRTCLICLTVLLALLALSVPFCCVAPSSASTAEAGDSAPQPIEVSFSLCKDGKPVHVECVRFHTLRAWQQRVAAFFGLCPDEDEGPTSLLQAESHALEGAGSIKGDSQDIFCLYVQESMFPLELSVSCEADGIRMSMSPTLTAESIPFSSAEEAATGQSVYEFRFRVGDEQADGIDISRYPAADADEVQRCGRMKLAEPKS